MSRPGLIVKTHAFGDALLATPAVAALVAKGGTWWVLAGPSSREVWRRIPGIERVITAPFPRPGARGAVGLLCWSLLAAGTLRKVDRSVVFHASPGLRRWVRLMTRSTMSSGGSAPLGPWERVHPLETGRFAGESYAGIADVSVSDYRPVFRPTAVEAAWAASLVGGRDCIAIAPGGGRNPRDTVPEKRWGADGFAELVERIRSRGMHTLLLGDGMDRRAAARVMELAGQGGLTDLTGKTGWGTAAALISECRAFVGPDSGLAHLACAVGTPAVVMFGPTDPASLYAPSLVSPVRTDAECAPCYSNEVFRGCVRGECDCMFRIKPGTVWSTLERILDEDERS